MFVWTILLTLSLNNITKLVTKSTKLATVIEIIIESTFVKLLPTILKERTCSFSDYNDQLGVLHRRSEISPPNFYRHIQISLSSFCACFKAVA